MACLSDLPVSRRAAAWAADALAAHRASPAFAWLAPGPSAVPAA